MGSRRGREPKMGCSISGLNALYDAATGGGDVWINERCFHVLRQIGEGGFGFVYSSRSTNLPQMPCSPEDGT